MSAAANAADRDAVSSERRPTIFRRVIVAAVGAAIVLLLGGMYFATNAGTDYPEASPIAVGD